MFAVTAPDLERIYFIDERPEGPGLEVEEGVRLEFPGPEPGPAGPDLILCRSKGDPNFFTLLEHRGDFDPAEFEEAGKRFGGIHTRESFDRVLRWKATMKTLASIRHETDTEEAWDDALRNLGVAIPAEEEAAR